MVHVPLSEVLDTRQPSQVSLVTAITLLDRHRASSELYAARHELSTRVGTSIMIFDEHMSMSLQP
jgi:hypothetical protein